MNDTFQSKTPLLEDFSVLVLEPASQLKEYGARLKSLIKRSLSGFEEYGGVIDAVYRRLAKFEKIYEVEGASLLVLLDKNKALIGTAGVGPLAGLPVSEGMGEIRDLVISSPYRGRGLGAKLLRKTLNVATKLGYSRIYLETTPQMLNAQKLFKSFGFSPLPSQKQNSKPRPDFLKTKSKPAPKVSGGGQPVSPTTTKKKEEYPAYFILDDLIPSKEGA